MSIVYIFLHIEIISEESRDTEVYIYTHTYTIKIKMYFIISFKCKYNQIEKVILFHNILVFYYIFN